MNNAQFNELKGMIIENRELIKQNTKDISELKELKGIVKQNTKDIVELKEIVKENTKDIAKLQEAVKHNYEEIVRQGAIFENEYGDKISAIFDKLMLIDDIKKIENEEFAKFKTRFERNDTVLLIHDDRISKLERKVGS